MELIRKSSINVTWKLCTIAGFLGLFLLTFIITNNTPQTFQISASRSTAAFPPPPVHAANNDVASFLEEEKATSSATANTTAANNTAEGSQPASQPNFTNISDAVMLQSFDPPNLEEKMFPSSLSSPEVESATSAGAAEYETPADRQAHFTNSSSDAVLFQSLNSSAFEEKLFSSLPESDPTSAANATSPAGQHEILTGQASYKNSSEEEKLPLVSPEAAAPGPGGGDGGGGEKKCRMYEGRWVYKPAENPRYRVSQCNFLEEKMSCRRNGRPDSDYEGWGWESDGCHVPLFNGTDMLERLRGKRMLLAGDSLNRNQWESLACLLYTSIPRRRAYVDSASPTYKVFKAKDYKFKLEFYWAPFLVDLDENHRSGKKVLSLDKMVPSSEQWRGADVMVFNSGHWWTHHGKFKAWDVFEYGGEQAEEMQTEVAYERALAAWAQWVAHNVDPAKTKVYFRSISPEHKGKQWCFNHSRPMAAGDEPYRQIYPRSMIDVSEGKLREMNGHDERVRYLNITALSSHRIDAHPSIYRFKHWKVFTEKYKRLLPSRSDCSHWCLPGLPDTWNRILYGSLFFDHLIPGDLSTS